MGKLLFVLGFAFFTAVSVFADPPRDAVKLRQEMNAKKKAYDALIKSRRDLESIQKPTHGQNDCSACETLSSKCNNWPSIAEKRESVKAVCEFGKCDIHPQTEKDQLCIAIKESDCFDAVLEASEKKLVQRCWRVVKQENIDSTTGKIVQLAREINALEMTLENAKVGNQVAVENEHAVGKDAGSPPPVRSSGAPKAVGGANVSN